MKQLETSKKANGINGALVESWLTLVLAHFFLLYVDGNNPHNSVYLHKITDRVKYLLVEVWITSVQINEGSSPRFMKYKSTTAFSFEGWGRKSSITPMFVRDQKTSQIPRWEYRHFLMSLIKLATADIMDQATIHTHISRFRKKKSFEIIMLFSITQVYIT